MKMTFKNTTEDLVAKKSFSQNFTLFQKILFSQKLSFFRKIFKILSLYFRWTENFMDYQRYERRDNTMQDMKFWRKVKILVKLIVFAEKLVISTVFLSLSINVNFKFFCKSANGQSPMDVGQIEVPVHGTLDRPKEQFQFQHHCTDVENETVRIFALQAGNHMITNDVTSSKRNKIVMLRP